MRPVRWMAVAALALLCAVPACTHATAQGIDVSDGPPQDFNAALSPYGDWVMTSGYGAAWRPWPSVVGADFVPYVTGGRWVSSGYGWMFVTGWSWGWAPFHYGRWFYDPAWGWLWIPGNTWAPAWVEWRYGGGYVGWSALPPAGWGWGVGWPGWCYASAGALASPEPWRHRLHGAEAVRAHDATAVVPPVGPPPNEVARQAGVPVPRATVRPPSPGRAAPADVQLPMNVRPPPPPSGVSPRVPPRAPLQSPSTPPGLPPGIAPHTPGPAPSPSPHPSAPPPGAPMPPSRPGPVTAPPSAPPPSSRPGAVPPQRPGPPPGARGHGR